MKNIAVIGGGYWGKNLIRNFHELGVLEVICDSNRELLDNYREKYPEVKITDDYEDILRNKKITGIVIALPAVEHYRTVKMALEKDKDVFVEKPMALRVSEAEELLKISEKNKRILMVGHILQYHPAVIKLKEMIDEGELGKIQYIYSNRLNIGKIRTEENILWSFAPHDISTILMFLNETPESIYATGGCHLQEGIVDETVTTMDFKNEVKAHIFVSWLHPVKEQKLVVVGSSKMAIFDDTSDNKLITYSHKIDWKNRIPVANKTDADVVELGKTEEPLRAECKHFLECINERCKPKTDANEGLRVLRVLSACQESLNKNSIITLSGKKDSDYYVDNTSIIDSNVDIGEGTKIWQFSHVLKGSKIGKKCNIGQNVVIGPNAVIGKGCKIQNNVSIYEGVVLEDYVFCGPSMVFTNVVNPRCEIVRKNEYRKTPVGKGASIGANATIVCGNKIGKYAFIGAGAVVTKNIDDYALVVGNPAKRIGWMCECGMRLNDDGKSSIKCKTCEKEYKFSEGKLIKR